MNNINAQAHSIVTIATDGREYPAVEIENAIADVAATETTSYLVVNKYHIFVEDTEDGLLDAYQHGATKVYHITRDGDSVTAQLIMGACVKF